MLPTNIRSLAAVAMLSSALAPIAADHHRNAERSEAREASATSTAQQGTAQRTVDQRRVAAAVDSVFRFSSRARYPNGPGWSQAKVQRMARKRRNVASNRRAQKRAGR